MQLVWGAGGQICFKNEEEYYEALGIFANPKLARVYIEDNAKRGSFTDAYRILLYAQTRRAKLPGAVVKAMKDSGRINCNPYVENLLANHGFVVSGNAVTTTLSNVMKTIPETESRSLGAFLKGYYLLQNEDPVDVREITYSTRSIDVAGASLVKKEVPDIRRTVAGGVKKKMGKRDYIKAAIDDYEIGEAGERIVYAYEKEKLAKALREGKISDLKDKLEWVSRTDDSAGYDIRSYDVETGKLLYIEVKTTTGNAGTPFYVSENEAAASNRYGDCYRIYRLYNMDRSRPGQVEFYILKGDILTNRDLHLEGQGYKATVKASAAES